MHSLRVDNNGIIYISVSTEYMYKKKNNNGHKFNPSTKKILKTP